MKQAVAALLAGAFLLAPAPTAAASSDPVAALKSQTAVGKGVTFTDVSSFIELSGTTKVMSRRGTLQYGKTGFAATDVSIKPLSEEKATSSLLVPERVITVGKSSYRKGGAFAGELPKGKVWVKTRKPLPAGLVGSFGQPVNAAEVSTLKALVSVAERSGRIYTGSITFAQLRKVSPWARATVFGGANDDPIRFTLTLGAGDLPAKLVTTFQTRGHWLQYGAEGDEISHNTVYKGWGKKYTIAAPPASQIYTGKK
ncbi:hypothetical protein [Nonomuraea typhae]|uniref:hypothetical protein n=1 Tax=Nonomuraea typhae TaxID=2603600 RepID=UPI0012FC560C|nr:hypothetical protein [Nonomuraea typhae]